MDAAVCADNVEAARVATQHLIGLGHRRIALLAGDLTVKPPLVPPRGSPQFVLYSRIETFRNRNGEEGASRWLTEISSERG